MDLVVNAQHQIRIKQRDNAFQRPLVRPDRPSLGEPDELGAYLFAHPDPSAQQPMRRAVSRRVGGDPAKDTGEQVGPQVRCPLPVDDTLQVTAADGKALAQPDDLDAGSRQHLVQRHDRTVRDGKQRLDGVVLGGAHLLSGDRPEPSWVTNSAMLT